MSNTKILIYLGHPAHYYLFKNTIQHCINNHIPILVCIKKKDVLEELLKNEGVGYLNIMDYERPNSVFGIVLGIWHRAKALLKIAKNFKPTVLAGTSAEITWVAKLTGAKSYVFNEDDFDVVKKFCWLAYPLATAIVAPDICNVGIFKYKHLSYKSIHELAYLHPNNFKADKQIAANIINITKPYFILRFSSLGAFHDVGKSGITDTLAKTLIELLNPFGNCYITSERPLNKELEPYRLNLKPNQMHHILAFAKLYIGDSQTMTAEAAVLGVMAFRFNDFVGRLNYLEELAIKFKLSQGFKTNAWDDMIIAIKQTLENANLKEEINIKKMDYLAEKIDPNAFFKQILMKMD